MSHNGTPLIFTVALALVGTMVIPLNARANASLQPTVVAVTPDANAPITEARKRALQLFMSLSGVKIPIDDDRLKRMEAFIAIGDERSAVKIVTGDGLFYDVQVRNMARKMSTRSEIINAPLSDFVATFVGIVRDSDGGSGVTKTTAKDLLTGNFYYMADSVKAPNVPHSNDDLFASNNHYNAISDQNLSLAKVLVRVDGQKVYTAAVANNDTFVAVGDMQPSSNVVAHPDPAGLLTSRAFQAAHAVEGTNRRLVEYAFREFMCQPIANWADNSAPKDYVGREVDRFPGEDPLVIGTSGNGRFDTTCRSCHGQMDAMRTAFAHADFVPNAGNPDQGKAVYTSGIAPKYARNKLINKAYVNIGLMGTNVAEGTIGYKVVDDNFVNLTTEGRNVDLFGWRGDLTGRGMQKFGQMLANSQGFSRCMVQRVFSAVCRREPDVLGADKALIRKLADDFESDSYHMKHLFESVAIRPECVVN